MEKDYYKDYYHLERSHWWFKARADILMSHIHKVLGGRRDLKILNIGVATGYSSELLAQFGDVMSVEYDKDCFTFVKNTLDIPIINASILDLPFDDEQYDLVCAFDVIEHVIDDHLAVAEMRRVCRTGGIMCVTVPAFMFLWSEHDIINHHYRRYTAPILRGVFGKTDKNIFHSYFNFWLFFPIALFRLISKIFSSKKSPDEASSDFGVLNDGFTNRLFYRIFKSENTFLKRLIALPVGVSILSTWRKEEFTLGKL